MFKTISIIGQCPVNMNITASKISFSDGSQDTKCQFFLKKGNLFFFMLSNFWSQSPETKVCM